MGRRARIRAFWDVRHGDTIVGLIKAIPRRGGTFRESSWAMSYTRGSTWVPWQISHKCSHDTPKWP